MITSMRVVEIEAKRGANVQPKGFDVGFNMEDVAVEKDEVKIKFSYTAEYKESGGYIKIKGELVAKEDKDTIKKVENELKNKRLPPEYMQMVVNAVNYFGTTHATVISTVLNTVPPIRMPNLQFKAADEKPAKK